MPLALKFAGSGVSVPSGLTLAPGALRFGFSWVSHGTSGRRGGGFTPPSGGGAGRTAVPGSTNEVWK